MTTINVSPNWSKCCPVLKAGRTANCVSLKQPRKASNYHRWRATLLLCTVSSGNWSPRVGWEFNSQDVSAGCYWAGSNQVNICNCPGNEWGWQAPIWSGIKEGQLYYSTQFISYSANEEINRLTGKFVYHLTGHNGIPGRHFYAFEEPGGQYKTLGALLRLVCYPRVTIKLKNGVFLMNIKSY